MITADDLLNDPKYREMSKDELKAIIVGNSHSWEEYGKLCKKLRKYGSNASTALIEYYKDNPITLKQMTSDMIKHPYILVTRSGYKLYVRPSDACDWWACSSNLDVQSTEYKNNLTHVAKSERDIISVLYWDGTVLWEREGKRYMVGVAEMDDNMELHSISAEKAERIKKIIEE